MLHKDNILQENLFIILTSMEMISLCREMVILHFKMCMPMRWLARNTHTIAQVGYNWSTRSMGKVIGVLYDVMCVGLRRMVANFCIMIL